MSAILDLSAADYHADNIDDTPSLSASIAHIICTRSPLHAWTAHPKLNPDWEPHVDQKFDLGSVVHAMLLEGDDVAVPVYADDWRTKAAKEDREAIRSAGKVPLLEKDWERAKAMTEAVWSQIAGRDLLISDGKGEQTLTWTEKNGVRCRARLDWLWNDYAMICDVKTTSRSANPEPFSRNLYAVGYDLKAAFYLRAVKAVTGVDALFRWIVIETAPPYALSVIEPGPDVLALGAAKVEYAIDKWRECLESGRWPGYPQQVCTAELPAWEEARWLEHEEVAVP